MSTEFVSTRIEVAAFIMAKKALTLLSVRPNPDIPRRAVYVFSDPEQVGLSLERMYETSGHVSAKALDLCRKQLALKTMTALGRWKQSESFTPVAPKPSTPVVNPPLSPAHAAQYISEHRTTDGTPANNKTRRLMKHTRKALTPEFWKPVSA
jgi:hypothetical protein